MSSYETNQPKGLAIPNSKLPPATNETIYLFFFPPLPDFEGAAALEEDAAASCFFNLPGCLGTNSAIRIISCFSATIKTNHNLVTKFYNKLQKYHVM